MKNGKRLKFGVKLNEFYEFERIGLFEQYLGESDPVLNSKAKAKLIGSVPIKMIKGKILIPIVIGSDNSKAVNLIFDSGAGGLLLDKEFASTLKVKDARQRNVTTSAGQKVELKSLGEIAFNVANLNFKSPMAMLTDFSPFTKLLGEPVYGLIGYDLLKDHLVELDLKKMKLNIFKGGVLHINNAIHLPLKFYKNTPIVEIRLNEGTKSFKGDFMFDTGAGSELYLNSYGNFKSDLLPVLKDQKKVGALDIAGNYTENTEGVIDGVYIGGQYFKDPKIQVEKSGLAKWSEIDGLIGLDLIKQFNIWFNYSNNSILLKSTKI